MKNTKSMQYVYIMQYAGLTFSVCAAFEAPNYNGTYAYICTFTHVKKHLWSNAHATYADICNYRHAMHIN